MADNYKIEVGMHINSAAADAEIQKKIQEYTIKAEKQKEKTLQAEQKIRYKIAKLAEEQADKELKAQQKLAQQTEALIAKELKARQALAAATEKARVAQEKADAKAMKQAEALEARRVKAEQAIARAQQARAAAEAKEDARKLAATQRQEEASRRAAAEEARKASLFTSTVGTQMTGVNSAGFASGRDLTAQIRAIDGMNNATVRLTGNQQILGRTYQTARVQVQQANGEFVQTRVALDRTTGAVYRLDQGLRSASRETMSFGQNLLNTMKKFGEWMLVATIMMTAIKAMQDAVKYIIDMDTALTSLNKVVDLTDKQMKDMTTTAIQLGKELGKSSVEIMKSMAEFGRITKNPEEIIQLARTAVMASNVTTLTAAEAAKSLSSAMISFKIDAKDSIQILDQWNELQNNFRVSAEDLAGSIGVVGSAAKQAGVSIQELEGYTTAIVSATGVTGDEAGTALKSMLSRIYRLGAEGAEDAGKTEEALNSVGIAVRKSATEFRDMEKILEDVKGKWEELNDANKMNIAQQIGGTHHYSKFIALMDNYKISIDATNMAMNSQGSAAEENAKHIQSIAGKLEILKVKFEEFVTGVLNSDLIKFVIDLGGAFFDFSEKVGSLNVLLIILGGTLAIFTGGTMSLIAIIPILIGGILGLSEALNNNITKREKLLEQQSKNTKASTLELIELMKQKNEYENLSEKISGAIDGKGELKKIEDVLIQKYPELTGLIYDQSNALDDNRKSIEKNIIRLKDLLQTGKEKALFDMNLEATDLSKMMTEQSKLADVGKKMSEKIKEDLQGTIDYEDLFGTGFNVVAKTYGATSKERIDFEKQFNDAGKTLWGKGLTEDEIKQKTRDMYRYFDGINKESTEKVQEYFAKISDIADLEAQIAEYDRTGKLPEIPGEQPLVKKEEEDKRYFSPSTSDSDKVKNIKTVSEYTKQQIESNKDLDIQIQSLNRDIKEYERLQKAVSTTKEKTDLIEKQNKALKEQQELYHQLANRHRESAEKTAIKLTDNGLDASNIFSRDSEGIISGYNTEEHAKFTNKYNSMINFLQDKRASLSGSAKESDIAEAERIENKISLINTLYKAIETAGDGVNTMKDNWSEAAAEILVNKKNIDDLIKKEEEARLEAEKKRKEDAEKLEEESQKLIDKYYNYLKKKSDEEKNRLADAKKTMEKGYDAEIEKIKTAESERKKAIDTQELVNDLLAKELEIQKAKNELSNIMNERNTRILRKDANGEYTWNYEADPKKIKEAQENIAKLEEDRLGIKKKQTEQELSDLADKAIADIEKKKKAEQDEYDSKILNIENLSKKIEEQRNKEEESLISFEELVNKLDVAWQNAEKSKMNYYKELNQEVNTGVTSTGGSGIGGSDYSKPITSLDDAKKAYEYSYTTGNKAGMAAAHAAAEAIRAKDGYSGGSDGSQKIALNSLPKPDLINKSNNLLSTVFNVANVILKEPIKDVNTFMTSLTNQTKTLKK